MKSLRLFLAAALIVSFSATEGRAHHNHANSLLGTLVGAGLGAFAGSGIGKGTGKKAAIGAGTLIGAIVGRHLFSGSFGHPAYAHPTYVRPYHASRVYYYYMRPYHPPRVYYYYVHPYHPPSVYYSYQQSYVIYRPRHYQQPVRVYAPAPPQPYCREFHTTVFVGGAPQHLHGIACLQPDGSWRIVK